MNAFEHTFRPDTRERSQARHELDGTFVGQPEVQPPQLKVSPDTEDMDMEPENGDPKAAQIAILNGFAERMESYSCLGKLRRL
jgi:hypothetical protein